MKAAGFPVALGLVLAALAGTSSRTHAATTVFWDGRALIRGLVDPGAPPEERAAAVKLARKLQKMSGIRWPVGTDAALGESGLRLGAFPGQPGPRPYAVDAERRQGVLAGPSLEARILPRAARVGVRASRQHSGDWVEVRRLDRREGEQGGGS